MDSDTRAVDRDLRAAAEIGLELRHLRHFVAVAETLNFTRAAERLNVAQQALSTSIGNLERQTGARMFARTTRSVALTEAGRALLPRARRTLAHADSCVTAVRRSGRATLRVAVPDAACAVVSGVLLAFRRAAPDVALQLAEAGRPAQAGAEAAIGWIPFAEPPLTRRTVHREPFGVLLPVDHPLAGHAELELGELRSEEFVLTDPASGSDLDDLVWALCAARGFQPRPAAAAAPRLSLVPDLVAAGCGVAVVPRSIASARSDLRRPRLAGTGFEWSIAWEPDSEPAAALAALALGPRSAVHSAA